MTSYFPEMFISVLIIHNGVSTYRFNTDTLNYIVILDILDVNPRSLMITCAASDVTEGGLCEHASWMRIAY